MGIANGPDKDRLRWFSCVIGQYILPTNTKTGSVEVKASSSAKKDKKKAAGKNKSKSTDQGKEDTKVTIEWEFTSADWPDGAGDGVETVLAYLDPNGERHGGPFDFSHPDSDRRGVEAVKVTKVDSVEWKGWHGKVKIECEEWTDPDAKGNAGAGGGAGGSASATPINPDKWTATNGAVKPKAWNEQQTAKTNPTPPAGGGTTFEKTKGPSAAP